jgi:hypothetical protein
MAKIKNLNGTSEKDCKCGSWYNHWKKHSGQTTDFCQAKDCTKTDLVGAHVKKVGGTDNASYIYPLCKTHNASTEEMEVSDTYEFVSANTKETCEK